MSEWLLQLLRDQPIAVIIGLVVMWWVGATTAAGNVFVLVVTIVLINALLQVGRWILGMLQKQPPPPTQDPPPSRP